MTRLTSIRPAMFASLALATTGLMLLGGCDECATSEKTAAENTAAKVSEGHKHDADDHSGHTHGPNGECPLDAETAVGVEEAKPEAKPEAQPVGG